jgi:hypothetical protein
MRKLAFFGLSCLVLGAGAFIACDADNVPLHAASATDGGGEGSTTGMTDSSTPSGLAKQTGRVVDFGAQGMGVPMATFDFGGTSPAVSGTADAKGNYTTFYPLNTPVEMHVTAADYYHLIEGEWLLKADADRGPTRLPSNTSAKTLLSALSLAGPVNAGEGILSVWAIVKAPCTDETGAQFDVTPKNADTHMVYLQGGIPNTLLGAAVKGENPHVVFYNLPPGQVTITVKHPTCGQLPYPQDDDAGFTYTGKIRVSGDANTLSFYRVFLGAPQPVMEAGSDADTDAGDTDASDAGTD